MTDMLIGGRKPEDIIKARLEDLARQKASTPPGVPKADAGIGDLEFKFYTGDFGEASMNMVSDGAFYAGAPRYLSGRINAKVDHESRSPWLNGCWTGELSVLSKDGLLVLPTKITLNYLTAMAKARIVLHASLDFPQDAYEKLRNEATSNAGSIAADTPFWIPRDKVRYDLIHLESLHESLLAVRACGGIEETKKYAAFLKEESVLVVASDDFKVPEGLVVNPLWVYDQHIGSRGGNLNSGFIGAAQVCGVKKKGGAK